jgi:hypothetical protein
MSSTDDGRAQLRQLFFGYAIERERIANERKIRFAYYTNADTALKIIETEEIWLRGTSYMNDAIEVRYGAQCLSSALQRGGIQRMRAIFDPPHPGLLDRVLDKLHKADVALSTSTYICCFSEHDPREDRYGRLSMWRAYGRTNGTALIFHGAALLSNSNALEVFASPVIYPEQHEFDTLFFGLCNHLYMHRDLIAAQSTTDVENDLWDCFRFAALSTKHPSFYEEREWRAIYSPSERPSKRARLEPETIGGIPQLVCKLPLKNVPEEGLVGMEAWDGLDRIILGTCPYPVEPGLKFADALSRRGVQNAREKIFVADLPLRL